jgi:hypothetical protein
MRENSGRECQSQTFESNDENRADWQENDQRVSVSVVLDQGFEVNVEVRKNSRQKSHVCWKVNFHLSASELGEEITPAAVSEKEQDSLRTVSASQLQPTVQLGILMVSVGMIVG